MSRADGHVILLNGLPLYGVGGADARFLSLSIDEYFRPALDVHPGMTVFDVGANIGMFTLEVLRRCGGEAQVFAFEPAPETFTHLSRNVRDLFPRSSVRLYRCALGDREREATLYYRPRAAATTSLFPQPLSDPVAYADGFLREPPSQYQSPWSGWVRRLPRAPVRKLLTLGGRWVDAKVVATPCRIRTLSAVLDEHGIAGVDLLKMDVEGAELDVLRGVSSRHWPKIAQLVVEVHDFDNRVDSVRSLLTSAGFDRVAVEQEWPFEGTNVYLVRAARTGSATAASI